MRAYILTEDSARGATDVIESLLKAVFRFISADGETPRTHRVHFEPASGAERAVMLANQWKSKRRQGLVALRRRIATELVSGGFVFFHADGDTRWSTRGDSPNRAPFDRIVRDGVRGQLTHHAESAAAVDGMLRRLHLLMPFYCIEAWLYQNTAVATRLCRDRGLDDDRGRFTAWAADRRALDEVWQPKMQTTLGDRGNVELAKGYPAARVYGESPSFTAFVDALLEDEALTEALRATLDG